jgi:PIN domain nuclease of toxin-antitoxin system
VTTLLLDTHVVQWWSADPARLSPAAARALESADELAVSAITWLELAWLARHERILISIPLDTWLATLAGRLRTMSITPAIAIAAASLPRSFPRDPSDRLIFATAVEHGWRLVTIDRRLRDYPLPIALW